MAFVYKILFFLATSFAVMSKLNGEKSIDASRYRDAAAASAAGVDERAPLTEQLSGDQAAAASRSNTDLWQSFEVAATDPELTDPSTVKPNPERLIDWYFHAADMKTKMDRQSNSLSPKYIRATRNERPVINLQSSPSVPLTHGMNEKLFKYDDLPVQSSHQSTEETSRAAHSPVSSTSSSETEEPLVTDYGARRTNDASMWYLRRFKSSDDSPADSEYRINQKEPISPSPTHHWTGSIDQTPARQYERSNQYHSDHRHNHHQQHNHHHHNHVNHQKYPLMEQQNHNHQRHHHHNHHHQQPQHHGSPVENEGAFHLSRASDRQYKQNNGNPSSIFKEASAVSTWEEAFPISDEFDSAFNSVVAGGDPISQGNVKGNSGSHSHQLSQVNGRSTRPVVDSFKYDYESASGSATRHHSGSGGHLPPPPQSTVQSKADHARPPTVHPNMYEPPGFPRRFYRLQL